VPPSFETLATLLAPATTDEFFLRHWQAAPMHLARHEPSRYARLVTPSDFDFIITLACELRNSSVELLLKGQAWGAYGAPRHPSHLSEVFDAYQRGATVRVVGAHRYWKPLWSLCRALQQELSFPVRSNLYCSPPGAQGVELHYDTHDVIVLQLSGRKHWRVFPPQVTLPLEHYPPLAFESPADAAVRRGARARVRVGIEREACGEPVAEVVLETGDLLYVPHGFVHEAWCEAEHSAHVSVGVHALTWADAAAVALGRRANQDEALRRSLPPGFARTDSRPDEHDTSFRKLLDDLAGTASARETLEEIAANSTWDQPGLGDGSLRGAHDSDSLDSGATVEHRPGANVAITRGEGAVTLVGGHKNFTAPAALAAALEFVARTPRFKVSELPGGLSDAGKCALVQRLVRDGFLRVVGDE
jgi:ribosomal protein L16 Arg81 hydroxylase